MQFRLRSRKSERPWWKLDEEVMESLVDLMVSVIGATVKDRILRAVLVALVVGAGNLAESGGAPPVTSVVVGK